MSSNPTEAREKNRKIGEVLTTAQSIYEQLSKILGHIEERLKNLGFQRPRDTGVMWDGSRSYTWPQGWVPAFLARAFVKGEGGQVQKGIFYYIPLRRDEGPLFVWGTFVLRQKCEVSQALDWRVQWIRASLADDNEALRLDDCHSYVVPEDVPNKEGFENLQAIHHYCMPVAGISDEKILSNLLDKVLELHDSK